MFHQGMFPGWWFSPQFTPRKKFGPLLLGICHHWQLHHPSMAEVWEQNFNVSMQSVKLFHSGCAINVSWNCLEKDGGCYGAGKEWMNWKGETTRCWWCCWIQLILNAYQESTTKSLSCFGRHWQMFQYEENVPFGTTGCATMTSWTIVAIDNLFPTSTLHLLLPQTILGSSAFLKIGWWTCLPRLRFMTL